MLGKVRFPKDPVRWGALQILTCHRRLLFPMQMPSSEHFETPWVCWITEEFNIGGLNANNKIWIQLLYIFCYKTYFKHTSAIWQVTIFNFIYCAGLNCSLCHTVVILIKCVIVTPFQGKDVPLNMFYADRIMQINPLILSLVNSARYWTQLEKIRL